MQLNAVIILKSSNEYNKKNSLKSGRKMDLYPALKTHFYLHWDIFFHFSLSSIDQMVWR